MVKFRIPSPADIWHAKTEAQLVALNEENAQYDDFVYGISEAEERFRILCDRRPIR